MRIPYQGHPDPTKFKHRFGTPVGEPCLQCGRRVYPVKLRVHMVNGGSELASIDEPDDPWDSEMGWHAIGPECAKKLPPNFVQVGLWDNTGC
jgi:hypothetical protein